MRRVEVRGEFCRRCLAEERATVEEHALTLTDMWRVDGPSGELETGSRWSSAWERGDNE